MLKEKPTFTPPEARRKRRAGLVPRVAMLSALGGLSAIGLVTANQDSNLCIVEQVPPIPGYSDPNEPLLEIIAKNELEGKSTPFTATDKDLSPASQQAFEEHSQKSIDEQAGCTFEIGQSDKN